jgi:hypothetical protein
MRELVRDINERLNTNDHILQDINLSSNKSQEAQIMRMSDLSETFISRISDLETRDMTTDEEVEKMREKMADLEGEMDMRFWENLESGEEYMDIKMKELDAELSNFQKSDSENLENLQDQINILTSEHEAFLK